MIHHVVLFRFRPGTGEPQIAAARDALLAMRGRIPEVRDVRFERNLSPAADEWPWVLLVVIEGGMAGVQRYSEHPVHVETVSRFLAPMREARLAIDLEVAP